MLFYIRSTLRENFVAQRKMRVQDMSKRFKIVVEEAYSILKILFESQ